MVVRMEQALRIGWSAAISGSTASVVTAAAVAGLARLDEKAAVQPINATSHWLHGDGAARVRRVDLGHTAVGFATHHASAVFWALPFEAWQQLSPPRSGGELVGRAMVMSAAAAFVDYCLTPKRLTPGWEHVLPRRSMVGAFAALALGLAAGAAVSQHLRAG